ncbi:hypothetical protein TanjilG_20824 [Lupinus angustifolius]|uniref:Uncharacterized protein n=1 Tax=Lupinus angustifolius TaxID=3871 RepID=A0A4P1QRT8_LUPAN|nr:hypothetical protein TanjilG_20824 [Lupinus angustifolius]
MLFIHFCTVAWFNSSGMAKYLAFTCNNGMTTACRKFLKLEKKNRNTSGLFEHLEEASYYWKELYGHLDNPDE